MSDDEFDFDDLDSGLLGAIEAIEARHVNTNVPFAKLAPHPTRITQRTSTSIPPTSNNYNHSNDRIPTLDAPFAHSTPKKTRHDTSDTEDDEPVAPVPGPSCALARQASRQNDIASSSRVPQQPNPPQRREVIDLSSDDEFESFSLDENALREMDNLAEEAIASKLPGVFRGPQLTRQTTLTGQILPAGATTSSSQFSRTKSSSAFGRPSPKTKVWDHTAFAKTGLKSTDNSKAKGKGKAKAKDADEEEEINMDEVDVDAGIPPGPPPPMLLKPDLNATREIYYPLNHPKRDYQFNIIRNALFDNTLVALPTGLGKTFIAGVVMLNYYRWFPKGKIVFLAPTKPLVAQQIHASHQTCGIPGHVAAELTGSIPAAKRVELWDSKRVFYLTPQTFFNDLYKERVSSRDIVLVIIDEAHRATGNYAYCTAVRYMMRRNPHFRILALSATPGSNAEAVQAIVDNLHIGRIEIRNEQSLDLVKYVHKKHMIQYAVEMTPEMQRVREALRKLMETVYQPVSHFMPNADLLTLHDYRCTKASNDARGRDGWAKGPLMNLATLARAMQHLHSQSIQMCYDTLSDMRDAGQYGADGTKNKGSKATKIVSDPHYLDVLREIEAQKRRFSSGTVPHPKIEKLRKLLLEYFNKQNAADDGGEKVESKVMVFAHFRATVDEIVNAVNAEGPTIRAKQFIGQSGGKNGKGLTQKEQLQVIERFKKGEFNTLVCTSIGEEGLDIGEVDYIVCYDSHKAPIKMLQRIGRTGRKKDGHIAVIVGRGREEDNFTKAKSLYNDVQQAIISGNQLELYSDTERLVPDEIKPVVIEKVMEIEAYVKGGDKKKKMESALPGAPDGFVSVKDMLLGGKGKKEKTPKVPKKMKFLKFSQEEEDDDPDGDSILADVLKEKKKRRKGKGLSSSSSEAEEEVAPPPRKKARTKSKSSEKSTPAPSKTKKKKKVKAESPSPEVATISSPPLRPIGFRSAKDILAESRRSPPLLPPSTPPSRSRSPQSRSSSDSDIIPIYPTNTRKVAKPVILSPSPPPKLTKSSKLKTKASLSRSISPILNKAASERDSDMEVDLSPPRSSSSRKEQKRASGSGSRSSAPQAFELTLSESEEADLPPPKRVDDGAWLLDSSSDDDAPLKRSIASSIPIAGPSRLTKHIAVVSPAISRTKRPVTTNKPTFANRLIGSMGPPATSFKSPLRHESSPPLRNSPSVIEIDDSIESFSTSAVVANDDSIQTFDSGESSFAVQSSFGVRRFGQRTTSRPKTFFADSSSPVASPEKNSSPVIRRRRRALVKDDEEEEEEAEEESEVVAPRVRNRFKRPNWDRQNEFVAMEADLSGEDVKGGSSDSEGEEDTFDREFVDDRSFSQQSASYDQSAVYRQGLMTQAPGLNFRNKPVRAGMMFGRMDERRANGRRDSSSPIPPGSDDHYSLGSFVVDDEDISMLSE